MPRARLQGVSFAGNASSASAGAPMPVGNFGTIEQGNDDFRS